MTDGKVFVLTKIPLRPKTKTKSVMGYLVHTFISNIYTLYSTHNMAQQLRVSMNEAKRVRINSWHSVELFSSNSWS